MFPCEICEIFQNTYFEETCKRLFLFVSPENTIVNSSGNLGLDETLTESKVSFIKQNHFIRSNAAISFISELKKCFFNISIHILIEFLRF